MERKRELRKNKKERTEFGNAVMARGNKRGTVNATVLGLILAWANEICIF